MPYHPPSSPAYFEDIRSLKETIASHLECIRVADVMTPNPISFLETDCVYDVAMCMHEKHFSCAPIKNAEGLYIGAVSKSDFLQKAILEQQLNFRETPLNQFVSLRGIITVGSLEPVEKAVDTMLVHHIHHIFAVDSEGKVNGILSSYDVMRYLAAAENMRNIFMQHMPCTENLSRQSCLPECS